MVVSRSDIKRRQKDGQGSLPESPKRTKVHAQRKFAQGSNLNTPALTPVKEKDKSKVNGTVVPTELLPAKRPNTEDFLTFLCFRGTRILPPKLDFFNVAKTPEQQDEDSKADHSVAGSSRVSARCIEKSFPEQSVAVAKAETKTRNKPKPTAAVQAFKKKYQEQRLAKQKISLTKLAQKVKGKNMVRTRSAALLEGDNRRGTKVTTQRAFTVAPTVKVKVAQKSIKRLVQNQNNNSLRGGLRSGGELPPGSEVGLKSERKPRPIIKEREQSNTKTVKRLKAQTSKAIASSLSDFSSDDDQPLIKKQRITLRRQRIQANIAVTRSNQLGRLRRNRSDLVKKSVTIRPTRKTKEAAALFLEEMIGKDLRSPDEDSDYNDEILSEKSFPESSASKKSERKEVKNTLEKTSVAKASPKDHAKRDNSNPEIIPTKKKKEEEDKKLLKKTVVKLNMIKDKDTKKILKTVKKISPDSDTENKPTTSKGPKEDKNAEIPIKTKGKTPSASRLSSPETSKVDSVKRITRQRPGNLSLDSSPAKAKLQLSEIDDKFSDSDEEPLGNISSQSSVASKKLNTRKISVDKSVAPVLRKETITPARNTTKKSEIKKVESFKKGSEKESKNDDVKHKSVSKKESLKKSLSEEDVNLEEKLLSSLRTDRRSKFRNTKSTEDLGIEVKNSNVNKGSSKSLNVEAKSNTEKKVETGSNKLGITKVVTEKGTESTQKPKLKKGWVVCDDFDDSSSDESLSLKDAKPTTVSKSTVSKKEMCKKQSLPADKTVKPTVIESPQPTSELPNKKTNKKNSGIISENMSVDSDDKSQTVSSKSDQLNSGKNKTKQTNKKSNAKNIIENPATVENKSKIVSQKPTPKESANCSVKNPKDKNCKKSPVNIKTSDSPDSSVKLNECTKKNNKNNALISVEDDGLHSKKPNKNNDESTCEIVKSSNLKNSDSEVNQTTSQDNVTGCEILEKESNSNNNLDKSPSLHKRIDDSNFKAKLKKEITGKCSNISLPDSKSNKTNKSSINNPSDVGAEEIKTTKNKKSSQKVNDKQETTSLSNKEDFLIKDQEKKTHQKLPIETVSSSETVSIKTNTNSNKCKVPDSKDKADKIKEKVFLHIESPQVSNLKAASTTCLESEKNKSPTNSDIKIITKTSDESCTKHTLELDKSKSLKKQKTEVNPNLKEVDMMEADTSLKLFSDAIVNSIRLDTSSQKIHSNLSNNNNFETDNSKETQNIAKKIVSNQTVYKEQQSSSKYIPALPFNRNVESPLLHLQTPKSNIDQVEQIPFDQPETTLDVNNMQSYLFQMNRTPQQRPIVQKLNQPIRSSKAENFPNERSFFKEGVKHNLDIKIAENIDTKDRLLNLDQPKNIKNSPKPDEKLKNETFFGSTKEIKNIAMNELKPKVDMPLPGFQLLKSSTQAKSMLKPGTLIDIAGGLNVGLQSDSLTNFMRPPLDNAMTKAIKTDSFPPESSSIQPPASAAIIAQKVEVKIESFSFATNKSIKEEFVSNPELINTVRKERVGSPVPNKNKTSVNDTWRQAFKNVKIPKPSTSNVSTNSDKPLVRKPLSVTALAKKHTLAKTDSSSPDKAVSSQPSIPFQRQSKLFLGGGNQSQTNNSKLSAENSKMKMNSEIDMNNLRKKRAEVEEIVRRYVAGEFANTPSETVRTSGTNDLVTVKTEININTPSNLSIAHQREEYVNPRSHSSIADRIRTSSPITNISQLKEEKGGRNSLVNEITRSNSPFATQQIRDGNDTLETSNSLGPFSTQHKEDVTSTFTGSLFSSKDRTPSPSSLSRTYGGMVEEHSPRHIPIPNLPMFSKSIHSNASPSLSEAKHHHLPLPVEQTLKKLSLTKMSKKLVPVGSNQTKSQEIKDFTSPILKPEDSVELLPKPDSESNIKCDDQTAPSFDLNRANIPSLRKETTSLNVDLMVKKRVNMTTEEITKWLSDSTSVGIEHKQNCGIFDKNHCECGYKTVPLSTSSDITQENPIIDEVIIEKSIIPEPDIEVPVPNPQNSKCIDDSPDVPLSKTIKNDEIFFKLPLKDSEMPDVSSKPFIDTTKQIVNQDVIVNVDVKKSNSPDEIVHLKSNAADQIISNPTKTSEDLNVASKSTTIIHEPLSSQNQDKNNIASTKSCPKTANSEKPKAGGDLKSDVKPKGKAVKTLKLIETPGKNKKCQDSEIFESDVPTSPIAIRPRVAKQTTPKHGDSEAELSSRDPSDVSSPPPRDDVSSSNDDSPDKFVHPERRSIFHQRRVMKIKERKEPVVLPSTTAFSPDNESSVYAFDPDLPPTSSTPPFRRCKKDGRTSSTATDDDESTPSSASIAVQVNLDNETVLECSTQTEVQDDDDGSEGHLFYIPLQQSHADVATTQQLIQGIAVKLGTEGPDQRVFMRAKLVTKPPSTFSRQPPSSATRALMPREISRSGKPEQKVRPLSVKPPVGTVTPTTRASPSRSNTHPVSIQTSPKPDYFEVDEKNNAPGPSKPTPVETETKPTKTKSPDRTSHATGKTPKRGKGRQSQVATVSVCRDFPAASDPAKLVEAPTFYPNNKEFQDPLEYIDSIRPQAEKFGLCRVVPPSDFKPECKVSDDMRFTAYNQYIHKMLHRWGPNVKEMMAIRKYLATQSIALTQPPWVGGMEVDLPRLYQTVQICGGLKEVIEKKRWNKVADTMKIPKSAQDRVTKLDDIYCKFLLPYDTLSHEERTKLFKEVENDWAEREKRVNNATDSDSEDSDSDDIDECIVKGRNMALNAFYRIARNTMSMWFSKTEQPGASEVETEFWRHVNTRQCHVCVHSGSIDSGSVGYGFPVAKNSSTSRHPWNLKVLTNSSGSILRSLGPLMGVTVPTLHVGMLFSACCWYRDPHGLPWIEYLHTGASKIWYGIPDSSSSVFREAATKLVPRLCRDKTIWLASDTAMVPPPLLVERGVSLSRIVQEPGQFIIVFPKAFTSSICTGYVVSESVYFAQPSWLASAQQIFDDIKESCEPSMFSLEKLLFSITIDNRSSVDVLNQILPMMLNIQDGEIARRKQLEELGLSNSERLPVNKSRKNRPTNDGEADYECDTCRANLFLSLVTNTQEESVYCLSHAIELLSKKRSQLKHCSLMYTYSEDELNELVDKLKSRIETKSQKKLQGKNVQANKS